MALAKVVHLATVDISIRYQLLNQLLSLQQAGYEVASISAPGANVSAIESAGIRHIAVPMTRNFTPVADLSSLWQLYRVMRRERFTIVHTHSPKGGLLGQLAGRMAGAPIVLNTIHGFYFHDRMDARQRRFYVLMEKLAARCSDAIMSQNQEDIETAVREGICPARKIKYLGNGIDVQRFDPARLDGRVLAQKRSELNLRSEHKVVGFVGRLVAEKGILELLSAARTVKEVIPEVRFLIVGLIDAEKLDVVTPSVALDHGVGDVCIFTGVRQDMPDLYGLMNVFVLPSHREGFPRTVLEASAMAVPCVVTDIRGCREAVFHRRNGLLTPLADAPSLAGAIIELLGNPLEARRMGDEGRRMALECFDEQTVFDRVKSEYARLLAEKGLASSSAAGHRAAIGAEASPSGLS